MPKTPTTVVRVPFEWPCSSVCVTMRNEAHIKGVIMNAVFLLLISSDQDFRDVLATCQGKHWVFPAVVVNPRITSYGHCENDLKSMFINVNQMCKRCAVDTTLTSVPIASIMIKAQKHNLVGACSLENCFNDTNYAPSTAELLDNNRHPDLFLSPAAIDRIRRGGSNNGGAPNNGRATPEWQRSAHGTLTPAALLRPPPQPPRTPDALAQSPTPSARSCSGSLPGPLDLQPAPQPPEAHGLATVNTVDRAAIVQATVNSARAPFYGNVFWYVSGVIFDTGGVFCCDMTERKPAS